MYRQTSLLPSVLVSKYWDDVIKYSKNPHVFSFRRDQQIIKDCQAVRKLIHGVIRSRSNEDIWPSFLCREVCEYYQQVDDVFFINPSLLDSNF